MMNNEDSTHRDTGPAVKVPGLIFCSGQTATGEIKQATVSHRSRAEQVGPSTMELTWSPSETSPAEPQGSAGAGGIVARECREI